MSDEKKAVNKGGRGILARFLLPDAVKTRLSDAARGGHRPIAEKPSTSTGLSPFEHQYGTKSGVEESLKDEVSSFWKTLKKYDSTLKPILEGTAVGFGHGTASALIYPAMVIKISQQTGVAGGPIQVAKAIISKNGSALKSLSSFYKPVPMVDGALKNLYSGASGAAGLAVGYGMVDELKKIGLSNPVYQTAVAASVASLLETSATGFSEVREVKGNVGQTSSFVSVTKDLNKVKFALLARNWTSWVGPAFAENMVDEGASYQEKLAAGLAAGIAFAYVSAPIDAAIVQSVESGKTISPFGAFYANLQKTAKEAGIIGKDAKPQSVKDFAEGVYGSFKTYGAREMTQRLAGLAKGVAKGGGVRAFYSVVWNSLTITIMSQLKDKSISEDERKSLEKLRSGLEENEPIIQNAIYAAEATVSSNVESSKAESANKVQPKPTR